MRRILMFARAPRLGQVKTRLRPALPDEEILQLHKALILHTLTRAREARFDQLELWADCQAEHEFFLHCQSCDPALTVFEQLGEDLGARMAHALANADDNSDSGSAQVLIGSDCPAMDADYLNQAFDRLEQGAQVVVGPALDGGYVLIGSTLTQLPIFDGMPWGGDTVLEKTISRLEAAAIKYELLAPLPDVDRPEDLDEAKRYKLLPNRA